jgi:hypothetical protein
MTLEISHVEYTEIAMRINTKAEIATAVWNHKTLEANAGLLVKNLAGHMEILVASQVGNWEIKNNQMLIYDTSGEVMLTYNLYDSKNKPSMGEVFRRELI